MSEATDKDATTTEPTKEAENEPVEEPVTAEKDVTDELLQESVPETDEITENLPEEPKEPTEKSVVEEEESQPMEVEQTDAENKETPETDKVTEMEEGEITKDAPSMDTSEPAGAMIAEDDAVDAAVEDEQEDEVEDEQEEEDDEEEEEEMHTASEGSKSPKQTNGEAKSDKNLLSEENLDRESPEIWPEKIPGVQDFVQEHANEVESSSPPTWTKGLTQEDIDQMHELGAMSNSQLILEIKKLYDHAYKIGVEESKEMSRGKILQIFSNSKKK